jgi:hypothetical protein
VTTGEVIFEPLTFRGGAEPVEVPVAWRLRSPEEWIAATNDATIQHEHARAQHLIHATAPIFHRTLVRQRPLLTDPNPDDIIKAAQVALQLTPGYAQGRPLRSLSNLGVDTKFFERNRTLLLQLLDARFDGQPTDLGLETFLHALDEADHWLLVAPLSPGLLPFEQQRVRASELQSVPLPGTHLLIVENERSLHQLPHLPNTIAILGAGLNLQWMSAPWLRQKHIGYWGDMDTWGLTILAKARTLQPHLTALMMSQPLFDACNSAAVAEHSPAPEQPPEDLTPAEQDFYRYLRTRERGRVEQEFLPREQVAATLTRWQQATLESPAAPRTTIAPAAR